jgi:hypothetical protein
MQKYPTARAAFKASFLVSPNASSYVRSPKSVVNLIIGFIATEEVSLNESPTVAL